MTGSDRHDARRRRAAALVLIALLAACDRPDETVPANAAGTFEVRWTGELKGSFSAPAVAGWCAGRREVLITAQRSDTGIALLVASGAEAWLRDSVAVRADLGTPRAGLALRTADRQTLRAWRGDSGWARLGDSAATLSGSFTARLVTAQSDGAPTLRVHGTFSGVPFRADTGCTPATPPPPPVVSPLESGAPGTSSAAPPAGSSSAAPAAGGSAPRR